MSDNNTSSSADAANPTNDSRRGVEIHQAEAVEVARQAGEAMPTNITVQGNPGAVNFIAKTTDADSTIAVGHGDAARKVMADQLAYHQNMFGGNCRIITMMRTVPLENRIITMRRSVPLEAAVADDQAAVNNTRA